MTQSLRKLASAATPGPWKVHVPDEGHTQTLVVTEHKDFEPTEKEQWKHIVCDTDNDPSWIDANAAYIAAANPTAILALLDEHEAALSKKDKRIAELEGTLEILRTDVLLLLGAVQAQDPNAELRLRCADILRRAAACIEERQT